MSIAVSGVGGQLGRAVIENLLNSKDVPTLVGITRAPHGLDVEGVKIRFGDYDIPSSLLSAYEGVKSLLLIPSMDLRAGRRGRQLVNAIEAAVEVGVEHIVLMSAAGACNAPAPNVSAEYFMSEQYLMRNAPRWAVLRMSYYAEAFAQEVNSAINGSGELVGIGESKVSFVSREDLATAAAALLKRKGDDGAIYTGTGPDVISGTERARIAEQVTGRKLIFKGVTEDELLKQFIKIGLPSDVAIAATSVKKNFSNGDFNIVTGDIERLTGRAPQTLIEVLEKKFKKPPL